MESLGAQPPAWTMQGRTVTEGNSSDAAIRHKVNHQTLPEMVTESGSHSALKEAKNYLASETEHFI